MTAAGPVLRAGALELGLAPAAGGALAWFDRIADGARQHLLRPAPGARRALDAACFALVPFCNRIRGGRFAVGGREVVLAPNMPPDPSPLHGQGWLAAWQVAAADAHSAELRFDHPAGEWPWRYAATQQLALDPAGLSLTLACQNLSDRPMPCALGLHPYFPCDAATRLDTGAGCAWTVDAAVLPVAQVPATGRYDLRDRAICGQGLDNGFGGWSGSAAITWRRGHGLRLTSADARFFQVYSPRAGGVFVAEPVQNANAALNEPEARWAELGIALLAPGEERRLRVRLEVTAPPA